MLPDFLHIADSELDLEGANAARAAGHLACSAPRCAPRGGGVKAAAVSELVAKRGVSNPANRTLRTAPRALVLTDYEFYLLIPLQRPTADTLLLIYISCSRCF